MSATHKWKMVRIQPDNLRELRRIAKRNERSFAKMVNIALAQWIVEIKKAAQ